MKLTAILVDDERHSLETTSILIRKNCPEIEILAECNNPIEAVEIINTEEPNILFLDISMPRMNGFELLEELTYKGASVIFTTAHDDHALEGFKHGAIHYLVKPIEEKDLIEGVLRVKKRIQDQRLHFVNSSNLRTKIPIPTSNGIELIEVTEIIRCESDGNYTLLVFKDKKMLVAKVLKEIEKTLLEYGYFYRVHNSHLVNVKQISKYVRGDGGSIFMTNNEEIIVSRNRKNELLELLGIS